MMPAGTLKMRKVPVRSPSAITILTLSSYRPDALPTGQPTVSNHFKTTLSIFHCMVSE